MNKIVWAVDAFHAKPQAQLRALEGLLRVYGKTATTIQPIAVLPIGSFDRKSDRFLEQTDELAATAQGRLDKLLAGRYVSGLKAPKIVLHKGETISGCVSDLIRVAMEEGADAIAISSHGRSGVSRLVMGSFAENLVLHSPLPVLVTNPKNGPGGKVKTILFPTDFSAASRQVFERVVRLARQTGARVMIFHKLHVYYPGVDYPFVALPFPGEYTMKALRAEANQKAAGWLTYAGDIGVSAKFHLDATAGYPFESLIRFAKRLGGGCAIAMASQSGPVGSVILGSLTRQVLRAAPCPVLVVHAEQESLLKRLIRDVKSLGYVYSAQPVMT